MPHRLHIPPVLFSYIPLPLFTPFLPTMFFTRRASSFLCRTSSLSQSLRPKRPTSQFCRMASTLPRLPIFQAIASHDPQSTVVVHSASGRRFTYGELLKDVADAKDRLHKEAGSNSIDGQRIAFLVENGYDYVGARHKFPYPPGQKLMMANSDTSLDTGRQFYRSSSFPGLSGPRIAIYNGPEPGFDAVVVYKVRG